VFKNDPDLGMATLVNISPVDPSLFP
jgi:hypothetical protein